MLTPKLSFRLLTVSIRHSSSASISHVSKIQVLVPRRGDPAFCSLTADGASFAVCAAGYSLSSCHVLLESWLGGVRGWRQEKGPCTAVCLSSSYTFIGCERMRDNNTLTLGRTLRSHLLLSSHQRGTQKSCYFSWCKLRAALLTSWIQSGWTQPWENIFKAKKKSGKIN